MLHTSAGGAGSARASRAGSVASMRSRASHAPAQPPPDTPELRRARAELRAVRRRTQVLRGSSHARAEQSSGARRVVAGTGEVALTRRELLEGRAAESAEARGRALEKGLRRELLEKYEALYDAEEDIVVDGTGKLLSVRGQGKDGKKLVERILRQRRLNIYRRIDLIVAEKKLNEWAPQKLFKEELEKLVHTRAVARAKERQRKKDDDRLRAPGKGVFLRTGRGRGSSVGSSDGAGKQQDGSPKEQQLHVDAGASGDPDGVLFGGEKPAAHSSSGPASLSLAIPTTTATLPIRDEVEARQQLAQECLRRDPLHVDLFTMSTTLVPNQIVSVVGPFHRKGTSGRQASQDDDRRALPKGGPPSPSHNSQSTSAPQSSRRNPVH